jgi:hypothetical protein
MNVNDRQERARDPRQPWQIDQGRACGCRGTDDMCPCQNDNGREHPGAKIGRENREAIRAYFLSHVGVTNTEVAVALGLSPMAVGRHVKTLRAEWETR